MLTLLDRYDINDCCYAEVTGKCRDGVFLSLDNGEDAFAYGFTSLPHETVVYCSVLKQPTEDRLKLVMIESTHKVAI